MPAAQLRHAMVAGVLTLSVVPSLVLPASIRAALGAAPASPGSAEPGAGPIVPYRPPVDGVILEPFHVEHPFGPGNRGIDYGVEPSTPVRAAAGGEVVFAGPVAGTLHVTVRHADGLRTSYSFLASVTVRAGQRVDAGDVVGLSAGVVHFGVRDPAGTYLDPALLFSDLQRARLVPGGDDGTVPWEP